MSSAKGIDLFFDGADETFLRREREKARQLRKSRWWKAKLAQEKCHYCGQKTPASELTMDHIVPLSRGGLSAKNNLVPTCKTCNIKKKTLLPMEWEAYMDGLEKV